MMKRLLTLVCAIAVGACSDPGTGASLRMSLQVAPVDRDTVEFDPSNPESGSVPPTTARIQNGTLTVSGYFETPCMGDAVKGSARLDGTTVLIRIRAERVDNTCMTQPDPYTYDGRVHNLDSGTYRVLVEHERDARRQNGVVLDTPISID
jgi:hypothetical protein